MVWPQIYSCLNKTVVFSFQYLHMFSRIYQGHVTQPAHVGTCLLWQLLQSNKCICAKIPESLSGCKANKSILSILIKQIFAFYYLLFFAALHDPVRTNVWPPPYIKNPSDIK